MKRPEDPRVFLYDIQKACQLIQQFTAGMSFPQYVGDLKTRSAVERQLGIVGEAMGQMLRAFPEMEALFPEAPRIIGFRNHLVHGYASVSNQVVWGILEANLPNLETRIAELLARDP